MDLKHYMHEAARTRNYDHGLEFKGEKAELINYVLGLAGEIGEFVNLIKKWMFHGHPITREQFIDEIGDLMWYLCMIMFLIGLDPQEILEYNIDKLKQRYPEGFLSERSINRKEG